MSPPRLSALIVARNEEQRLPACLASVVFADEVVVVLDRSTDGSADLARAAGARVVEGAWELEGERRNAGIAACSGDWVLEVDADERVSPDLAQAVRRVIAEAVGVPERDVEVVSGHGCPEKVVRVAGKRAADLALLWP